ncbi:MAG: hypothetical protein ACREVE_16155 [Gammaproteobacteria bacterium]
MWLMFLLAITAACKSVRIGTAYFLPDKLAQDALVAAGQNSRLPCR